MASNSIDKLFGVYEQPSPLRRPFDFTVGRRHTHRHSVSDVNRRRLTMMMLEEMYSVGGNVALIPS